MNSTRRNFIKLTTMGAAAAAVAPQVALATKASPSEAGGIYFTEQNPGRWDKKIAGHLPNISVSNTEKGKEVKVVTGHEMNGYEHYIVKHVLLDENFQFLDEKMFDPNKDAAPISTFNIGDYSGVVRALSMCNKHDVWMNTASV